MQEKNNSSPQDLEGVIAEWNDTNYMTGEKPNQNEAWLRSSITSLIEARQQKDRELLVKADSMLSYILHRGELNFEKRTSFLLDRGDVEQLIGKLRSAYEN